MQRIATSVFAVAITIAIVLGVAPPSAFAASTSSQTTAAVTPPSGQCPLTPLLTRGLNTWIYLDDCNTRFLIWVGSITKDHFAWIKRLPGPVATAVGLFGSSAGVFSSLLSRAYSVCGQRGLTIYRLWWMPAPWYACGRTF